MNIQIVFVLQLIAVLLAWFGLRKPAIMMMTVVLVTAIFVVYGLIDTNTGISL